jgi:hypothetical protein
MILLAGVGAAAVTGRLPNVLPRLIFVCLLVAGALHLTWQSYLASYRFASDPRNPYVYAHPGVDVITIARHIEDIAAVSPQGRDMQIQVICPDSDYWPLPWYLRSFRKVGYWSDIDEDTLPAPIIIASASIDEKLRARLHLLNSNYVPLFNFYKELRPTIELRCYAARGLWDRYEQHLVDQVLSGNGR